MNNNENINIFIFLFLWSLLVILLFLHTSGKFNIALLDLKQATGSVKMVEDFYNGYTLQGLNDEIYAVPVGQAFVHPKRKRKMKRRKIFEAHSLQEAKRMIDAGTSEVHPKLILIESNFSGLNIYRYGNKFYGVPLQYLPDQYSEKYLGESIEEAKEKILTPD